MNANAIMVLAYRDLLKFARDPARIIGTLIFPVIFVGILGGSLQANLGADAGYNFLTFTFTGILAQTLWQSTAIGVVSLIEDRENDFTQEIFVSPISRYGIVFGKILSETLVALPQGLIVVLFGLLIGVPFTITNVLAVLVVCVAVCLFGGAFGVLVLANLPSQRVANQLFPFIIFPQFFLAGVFSPIKVLPWYLDIVSRVAPLRYAVDLMRGVFYAGQPDYNAVVLATPAFNGTIIGGLFAVFLVVGTALFVRGERNR
jgi:ABC-2 type transport system permease protein